MYSLVWISFIANPSDQASISIIIGSDIPFTPSTKCSAHFVTPIILCAGIMIWGRKIHQLIFLSNINPTCELWPKCLALASPIATSNVHVVVSVVSALSSVITLTWKYNYFKDYFPKYFQKFGIWFLQFSSTMHMVMHGSIGANEWWHFYILFLNFAWSTDFENECVLRV